MKKADAVKIEHGVVDPWVPRVLGALPGVIEVMPPPSDTRADLIVRVRGHRRPLLVEVKRHLDAAGAHALLAWAADVRPASGIVVARTSTLTARDILRAHGVSFADAEGNASIDLPGYVVRTGSVTLDAVISPSRPTSTPVRLSGKTGLVAQALLLQPDRAWRLKDLASVAGVSDALVHRILTRLEEAGLIASEGLGPGKFRRLVSPAALLDLWAEEDAEPAAVRTAAYLLAKGQAPAPETVSVRLAEAGLAHGVTGVAAAAHWAPALTATMITSVRVTAAVPADDVLAALGARRVDDGPNLVLVQGDDDVELRLARPIDGTWFAAGTRIYLDALRDPRRGREQAAAFRSAVFGF